MQQADFWNARSIHMSYNTDTCALFDMSTLTPVLQLLHNLVPWHW